MKRDSEEDSETGIGESHFFEQHWRGVCGLLLVVFITYLTLALFSYSPEDSAWTFINGRSPENSAGPVGAWLADILFTFFGLVTWGFIALSVCLVGLLFKNRALPLRYKTLFLLRLPALFMLLLSGCALAELYRPGQLFNLPVSGGGIAGKAVLKLFVPAFGHSGAALLLIGLLLTGLTLLTSLSWFAVLERSGTAFMFLSRALSRLMAAINDLLIKISLALVHGIKALIRYGRQRRQSRVESLAFCAEPASVAPETDTAEPDDNVVMLRREPTFEPPVPAQEATADHSVSAPLSTLPPEPLSTALLDRPGVSLVSDTSEAEQQSRAILLEEKLQDFGVQASVVAILPGPVVTRFEIQPAPGVKVNKISGLALDLARSLSVIRVRVVEVIPGKSTVGIEIPNAKRKMVYFSEVIESSVFERHKSPVALALGNDISGQAIVADLEKMPHLLVAGTTGSGKSVGVNAMILSILYKASPAEVRLIMVDPKMLELSVYEGIPHLLAPVVTDMKEAAGALRWCVGEMERRYKLMAALGVRNLSGYNEKVKDAARRKIKLKDPLYQPLSDDVLSDTDNERTLESLPVIVVVIDEFADMMMIVGKKVEELIARIAQKARAAGIHLILATQRPSVDVITGLIKANVPSRISFQVSSKIDSRTIIDQSGAEQLLGNGDMLYLPPGTGLPVRVHGAFVSDEEVHRVVANWKARGTPEYVAGLVTGDVELDTGSALSGGFDEGADRDELYDHAVAFVTQTGKVSVSSVQRQFKIGYNRAATIVECMEADGVVSAAGHNGIREVLAPPPPAD